MKRIIIFISLLLLIASSLFAQTKTTDLEIWGLPKEMTKLDFVNILNSKKLHVCMADIRPLGFADANVIGMDNIYLVTLRPRPEYKFDKKRLAALSQQAINKFQVFSEISNSHSQEEQAAVKNFFACKFADTATEQANILKRPELDMTAYRKNLQTLSTVNPFSSDECLAALYYSKADTLKEKALLAYISKIESNADVLKLLPFLLDSDVDIFVANILKNYFKYNNLSRKEWKLSYSDWLKVINSPNPTVTFFVTDILTQQKMPTEYKKVVLQKGSKTINEILSGEHKDIDFYKQKIYPFLTYLTGEDFSNDWKKWSNYIQNYN